MQNGKQIVYVRTRAEYQQGHMKGSLNIPLNTLANHSSKLDKNKTIITYCASEMRSAQGKSILNANGFNKLHNSGGWMSLKNKLIRAYLYFQTSSMQIKQL